jgi:very-short-patch-repair endonuclease
MANKFEDRRRKVQALRPRRDDSLRLRHFARFLRRESTDAEKKLWDILRSNQLGGFKFRRQHPVAGFILDFYCSSERLGIELDGGQHNDAGVIEYDASCAAKLEGLGVRLIRFWDHDVLRNAQGVAEEVYRHLINERPSPQPSPGVPGEGEKLETL